MELELDPVSAWTQILGDTAALIQLCPWYLKQLEDKEFGYITSDALNAAKALSTNPPPSTLSTGRKLNILAFLISPYSMRFVLRLSPAPTKADHDFEVHLLILLPLSYLTFPLTVVLRLVISPMGGLTYGG